MVSTTASNAFCTNNEAGKDVCYTCRSAIILCTCIPLHALVYPTHGALCTYFTHTCIGILTVSELEDRIQLLHLLLDHN